MTAPPGGDPTSLGTRLSSVKATGFNSGSECRARHTPGARRHVRRASLPHAPSRSVAVAVGHGPERAGKSGCTHRTATPSPPRAALRGHVHTPVSNDSVAGNETQWRPNDFTSRCVKQAVPSGPGARSSEASTCSPASLGGGRSQDTSTVLFTWSRRNSACQERAAPPSRRSTEVHAKARKQHHSRASEESKHVPATNGGKSPRCKREHPTEGGGGVGNEVRGRVHTGSASRARAEWLPPLIPSGHVAHRASFRMQDSPRILLPQAPSCQPVRGQGPHLHFTKHSQGTVTCVQVCVRLRTGWSGTL